MTALGPNRLLVDAEEFKADVEVKIRSAKDRIYVQVMTFELDETGKWLVELMKASPAREKVLCVDAYSLFNINDGWVFGRRYWTSPLYKKEVDETRRFLKSGEKDGIKIHLTNRLGWRIDKFPARNHKKLMIVDDVAYIGGLNFSDHNFAWHDLMATIVEPTLVESLRNDFQCTLDGMNQSSRIAFGNEQLYFLDGRRSADVYEQLFNEICQARHSVQIISPYVSDPLLSRLLDIPSGVTIEIITPQENNKSIMKHYLMAKTRKLPWKISLYQKRMSHIKAILIDGEQLVLGSSNFDFVSYHLEQEVVLITKEDRLIEEFQRRIWEVDSENSTAHFVLKDKHYGANIVIFVLGRVMQFFGWLQMKR
jgi:cardiolipin synthase